jgi:hypothetical protein
VVTCRARITPACCCGFSAGSPDDCRGCALAGTGLIAAMPCCLAGGAASGGHVVRYPMVGTGSPARAAHALPGRVLASWHRRGQLYQTK